MGIYISIIAPTIDGKINYGTQKGYTSLRHLIYVSCLYGIMILYEKLVIYENGISTKRKSVEII